MEKEISLVQCFLLALNNDLFEFKKDENCNFQFIVSCKDRSVGDIILHIEDKQIPEYFIVFKNIKKHLLDADIPVLKDAIKQKNLNLEFEENKRGIDRLIEIFGDQILK